MIDIGDVEATLKDPGGVTRKMRGVMEEGSSLHDSALRMNRGFTKNDWQSYRPALSMLAATQGLTTVEKLWIAIRVVQPLRSMPGVGVLCYSCIRQVCTTVRALFCFPL
jgi:hypothetical protein